MDISTIILIIQVITLIVTSIYVILVYKTIKSNQDINRKRIFNEIVKQERDLRIKLLEYNETIGDEEKSKTKRKEAKLNYDTLLFNYYEYLSVCLFKEMVNEDEIKLFFEEYVKSVKELFESSLLFKEKYATKEQYRGIQWLFGKWDLN